MKPLKLVIVLVIILVREGLENAAYYVRLYPSTIFVRFQLNYYLIIIAFILGTCKRYLFENKHSY